MLAIAGLSLCALSVCVVPAIGATTITTDGFGRSYAGQDSCISCHDGLKASDRRIALTTRHGLMVIDVRANPSKLVPAASSTTLWPSPGMGTAGIRYGASNVYLQIGGGPIKEHVTTVGERLPAVSPVTTITVPANTPSDDLVLFNGITFDTDLNAWESEAPVGTRGYLQRCGGCHNLGVTRPSADTRVMANGGTISPTTPTRITGLSIQCEVCHGTGKTASLHETATPEVVAWTSSNAAPGRIMSAELCGQCHATGTAKERYYAGGGNFSSPNGYTSDATLSAFFDVVTEVPTVASFTVNPTAYRFYPTGTNRNMNHVFYNEWLNNKAANGFGHVKPTNTSVYTQNNPKCLRCHSGEGFLEYIGDPLVPAAYNASRDNVKWGITCQVCHSAHAPVTGLGKRTSTNPKFGTVDCGDCHNWQFEALDQQLPSESAFATGYPGMRVRHPQREMNAGKGMFGVSDAGDFMDGVECAQCHMPVTREARPSHRFHVMLPGDAEEWGVIEKGDSCTPCHTSRTRAQLQTSIDEWQDDTRDLVAEATSTMNAARTRAGWTGTETAFIATKSVDPQVIAYKKAFHNRDFVQNDASLGAHNPPYAQAGLEYAIRVARSIGGSVSLNAPPAGGYGTEVALSGTAMLGDGGAPAGQRVELQARPVGESDFTTFALADTNALGAFSGSYRLMGEAELRAIWKSDSGDKSSATATVVVGSYGGIIPVTRAGGADRYETAAKASQVAFKSDSVNNVVLASGVSFADALSASGLAGSAVAPLLLTASATLPDVTLDEIHRVSVAPVDTTIWVVGGTGAISSDVVARLETAGFQVVRIGGANRFDTSRLVAERIEQFEGTAFSHTAFVVNGRAFADGLSVGPVAYANATPVLLTETEALPAETQAALDASGITHTMVVGGASAVSDAVLAELPAGSSRVASGATRYDTAVAFAQWALDEGLATPSLAGIASGAGFPDALSAGGVIGSQGGVLLLTAPTELSPPAQEFLSDRRDEIGAALLFGGTSAVSDAVRSRVYETLNP